MVHGDKTIRMHAVLLVHNNSVIFAVAVIYRNSSTFYTHLQSTQDHSLLSPLDPRTSAISLATGSYSWLLLHANDKQNDLAKIPRTLHSHGASRFEFSVQPRRILRTSILFRSAK